MATQIPDALKKDVPPTGWGKMLVATPVVMTVIATLLAGLASSEMTTAQYDRALGAQLQSKAGDQWAYFQAKKMRGAMQRNSLELLRAVSDEPAGEKVWLPDPPVAVSAAMDPDTKAAFTALATERPEAEIAYLLGKVDDGTLAKALREAINAALAFDTAVTAGNQSVNQLEKSLPTGDRTATRSFAASKMKYTADRYDAEAALNQSIAYVLELQVRKANISAERHHARSGKFFFGMLAAQAAVIVSTFALAARQRNMLWGLAAIAGIAAVIFAIYVYLAV